MALTVRCSFRPLVLILLASCAAFRGAPLEPLDRARVIEAQAPLPPISYECEEANHRDRSNPEWGWPRATTEALFCSAFVSARSGPADGDLHVKLHFRAHVQAELATRALFCVTILTLGIVPTHRHFDLELQASVEGPGRLPREYVYSEPVDIWIHLLLLPFPLWNHPLSACPDAFENMLLHFLVDLRRDLDAPGPS